MKLFDCKFLFFILFCLLYLPAGSMAYVVDTEAVQYTLGPIGEYRSSPAVDYSSFHLFGPIIKYESKRDERDIALRPLFYRSTAADRDAILTEVLFPLFRHRRDRDHSSYSFLRLINFESQSGEHYQGTEFSLMPLLFYQDVPGKQKSFAVFPVGGTLHNRLGRDKISYALWPLYIATDKRHTHVDNFLWPFFALISGDSPEEKGVKFWPLFGKADYPGVYRKFFLLWPFWFNYDEQLNTDNPTAKRYLFPLYLYRESPNQSKRTFLWPFFSYLDDRVKGYTEWNFPWPFWQRAVGEYKHGWRFLPFYADITRRQTDRTRWFLWPVLKLDSQIYEEIKRRRVRLLFFLYRDLQEVYIEPERERSRRVFLWPLFGYKKKQGVSHFFTLALLEPLFPEAEGLERNWSPLWRIYQKKWDQSGNSVTSLFWNLYWSEFREDAAAWELFPLFAWHQEQQQRKWSFLKGLIAYESDADGSRLKLLYLPWGIPLGTGEDERITD